MPQMRFYAPDGVSVATLRDGTRLNVTNGYVDADSSNAGHLLLSGFFPANNQSGLGGSLGTYGSSVFQLAANSGVLRIFGAGVYALSDPILVGSNTRVELANGVVLNNTGNVRHPWLRAGNAEFVACANINNVYIICADEGANADGTVQYGTMEFITGPSRLRWTAPGDKPGAYVGVSGASITNGWFTLQSGTAGRAIHVIVGGGSFSGGAVSSQVRIEPITGAKAMAWARVSNIVTVTEANHTKRRGDFVMVFLGGTFWHGYIASATTGTWTFAQTAADASGDGSSFSLRNIDIIAGGAEFRANGSTLTGAVDGHQNMGSLLFAVNDLHVEPPNITDNTKYGTCITGCSGFKVLGARMMDGSNDCVHITGPAKNWTVSDAIAKAGDNIIGVGCTDYLNYNVFWPGTGTVDVENYTISDIEARDSQFEPVRLYVANSGWLRNGQIKNITGTVTSNTAAMVGVVTDNNVATVDAGNTNIDGLLIEAVNGTRTDGVELRQFSMTGTGTRRGIVLRGIPWRQSGTVTAGAIRIDCPFEDVTVERVRNLAAADCCGDYINMGGSAVGKSLAISDIKVTRANSTALGADNRPVLVNFSGSTTQVENLSLSRGYVLDSSVSGSSKTSVFYSIGKKTRLYISDFRLTSTTPASRRADSLVRLPSAAEAGSTVSIVNADIDADFGIVMDGGVPVELSLCGYRQPYGSVIHGAVGSASSIRIGGTAVNAANLLSSTLTNINVDVRDGLTCDGTRVSSPQDGALIRNTNAAFATGTGLYYRAGAAWTKIG